MRATEDAGVTPPGAHPGPIIASNERGAPVHETQARHSGIKFALVFLGLFGAAFAITGLLVALPPPAVGGTCGPGRSSESALVAFFDPVTIGAEQEPPATDTAGRADWLAFVGECQSSADSRVLAVFAILVLSAGVALAGSALVLTGRRRSSAPAALAV